MRGGGGRGMGGGGRAVGGGGRGEGGGGEGGMISRTEYSRMKPPGQVRLSQAGRPLLDMSSATRLLAACRTPARWAAAPPDARNATSARTSTPTACRRRRWLHWVVLSTRTVLLRETVWLAWPAAEGPGKGRMRQGMGVCISVAAGTSKLQQDATARCTCMGILACACAPAALLEACAINVSLFKVASPTPGSAAV